MFKKIFSGDFNVYDVDGLDVWILKSIEKGQVDVYVKYRYYCLLEFVIGYPFETFNEESALEYIRGNFTDIMHDYFDHLIRLEY